MKHVFRGAMLAVAGVGLLWGGMALAGPTDADKCEADKLKRAGWYAFCRMKAESKAVKKGEPEDFTKCEEKIGEKFAKAEDKWGVECPTSGDLDGIKGQVTADSDWLALKLAGERFIDNGDGTVTDTQTGLMWEKKVAGSGCLHCASDLYDWYTAMSDWIPEVNGWSADGSTQAGLAGHTDWRMPTNAELQTILDCGFGIPCIDPIFGPTQSDGYWSSTTTADFPDFAWRVFFGGGGVNGDGKSTYNWVRAVRGGL